MKKLLMAVLLVLMARLPIGIWNDANDEQKKLLTDIVYSAFVAEVNPKCSEGQVAVYDGNDGFAYFAVECTKEESPKIRL